MKTLVKHLPSKKDIRDFYNYNNSKRYKVKKVTINKDFILLECKIKEGKKILIPSFYQEINFIDFNKKTFSIIITRKYWDHLIKNILNNLEYLKQTN